MGRIAIKRIELYGYHGVFEYERKCRQRFLVSVSFEWDIIPAAQGDALEKTVDYTEIVALCQMEIAQPRRLLETLAVAMTERIRDAFPGIRNLQLSIEKPEVQLGHSVESVEVSHHIP